MAESNINHEGIEAYASNFASKVSEDFFRKSPKINGKDILEFTPIAQVNAFILKMLLSEWKKEFSKLKSPYFDYEDAEVNQALKTFMNVLSKNIAISRADFEPLVRQAVQDAILIIYSPYDYYCKEIRKQDPIDLAALEEANKYIKVNKHLMAAYLNKLKEKPGKELPSEDGFKLLNEVFEEIQEDPEDFEPFTKAFSEISRLTLEVIYGQEKQDESSAQPTTEKPTSTATESTALNDRFAKKATTLNETLSKGEKQASLADVHEGHTVANLKSYLSLNQKFMFTKQIFGGNREAFDAAITFLDECQNRKDAVAYIKKTCKVEVLETEEGLEFLSIVDKKYP